MAGKPDGKWEFFELGALSEELEFQMGAKHGIQVLWKEGAVTDSIPWKDNQKEGLAQSFRPDGSRIRTTPFEANMREGKEVVYDETGMRIAFRLYKNNKLISSEQFNRYNDRGEKSGPWKVFHPSGRIIETGVFENGLRNGLFQWFDARGNVVRMERYVHGELMTPEELAESQVVVESIRNAEGKVVKTVTKINGVKEGPTRMFDEEENIIAGELYEDGRKVGEGITLMDGQKNGWWKEFDGEGNLIAEGEYQEDLRIGEWNFYRDSGELEQRGVFVQGEFDGTWTWWYPGGDVHRLENYKAGVLDGEFLELDTLGNPIVKGGYTNGLKDGLWYVEVQNYIKKGGYIEGMKHGMWQLIYPDNSLHYEGEWKFDQPIGKHKMWHANGALKEVGVYQNGLKHKKWKEFNPDGSIHRQYIYRYGELKRLDGVRMDKRRDREKKESKS